MKSNPATTKTSSSSSSSNTSPYEESSNTSPYEESSNDSLNSFCLKISEPKDSLLKGYLLEKRESAFFKQCGKSSTSLKILSINKNIKSLVDCSVIEFKKNVNEWDQVDIGQFLRTDAKFQKRIVTVIEKSFEKHNELKDAIKKIAEEISSCREVLSRDTLQKNYVSRIFETFFTQANALQNLPSEIKALIVLLDAKKGELGVDESGYRDKIVSAVFFLYGINKLIQNYLNSMIKNLTFQEKSMYVKSEGDGKSNNVIYALNLKNLMNVIQKIANNNSVSSQNFKDQMMGFYMRIITQYKTPEKSEHERETESE